MNRIQDIIPDSKLVEFHVGNFGAMSMRDVVRDGVVKSALGYDYGQTMFMILREHKLITMDKNLTKKGKRYARALWRDGEFRL